MVVTKSDSTPDAVIGADVVSAFVSAAVVTLVTVVINLLVSDVGMFSPGTSFLPFVSGEEESFRTLIWSLRNVVGSKTCMGFQNGNEQIDNE